MVNIFTISAFFCVCVFCFIVERFPFTSGCGCVFSGNKLNALKLCVFNVLFVSFFFLFCETHTHVLAGLMLYASVLSLSIIEVI